MKAADSSIRASPMLLMMPVVLAVLFNSSPVRAAELSCPVVIKLANLETKRAKIGDQIALKVENLSDAIEKCGLDPRKLVLYLNGHALKGVNGEPINRAENLLGFSLNRTSDSRGAGAR